MKIINPFYDASFKYLFQDPESARLILEVVTGFRIEKLQTLGQEYYRRLDAEPEKAASGQIQAEEDVKERSTSSPKLLEESRLDYVCRMVDERGNERVCLVEVQRRATMQQIQRFRRYLGFHYASEYNHRDGAALEILTVFFIGPELPEFRDRPLVKIDRKYTDLAVQQEFSVKRSDFAEKLTHLVYIVSVHALAKYRRTRSERVLQIFNQQQMSTTDKAILEIDEETFPKPFTQLLERLRYDKYQLGSLLPLIEAEAKYEQRLDRAEEAAEIAIKKAAAAEKRAQRKIAAAEKKAEQRVQQQVKQQVKQQVRKAEQRAEKEIERVKSEAQRVRQEVQQAEKQKKLILETSLKAFLSIGKSLSEAATLLNLSETEAKMILVSDTDSKKTE